MKKWKVNVVPKKEGTFKMNILCGNKPINTLPIQFSALGVPKTPSNIRIGSITHEGFQFTCDFSTSPVVLGTTMNGIKHNDSVIVEIAQKTKQGEGAPTLKGHTSDVDTVQWEEVYCGVKNTCTIGGGSSTPTNHAKGAGAKVKADTEYIVRCCLCDHLGCGDWAIAPHSVRTLPDPAPLAPINLRIVTQQQGPATPTLEWTPNPHGPRPSSFVIQARRSISRNPNQQQPPTEEGWAEAGTTTTTQQRVQPTSMDITHTLANAGGFEQVEFRVCALNGPSASSPWSNVALFKCEPPGDLHMTMFPMLDWSPPSPPTQPPQWYVVQRKPHNAPPESAWHEVCRGTQTSCDVTTIGSPPIRCGDNGEYDFRVGSLCAGVVMSTTWKLLQSIITGTFTWDPSSCYKTNLSDNNHIATGVCGNNSTTVWTTQCVTTGSVAVARITLIKRDTTCSTPCIGVVEITSNQPTPPSSHINSRQGFWGFNLASRNKTYHNGKQQPSGDNRNGYNNTPDGTVITVTVDMTHPGGGTMSVRVGDCDRGVVCCSGLPSPLRFAFSACCGNTIKIE
ncbi:hypothetical protein Pelo_13928 [Pelomyxa schiedti]|nr:hypothetical protein Pelo_13928 [Pelomyxa schiedti]